MNMDEHYTRACRRVSTQSRMSLSLLPALFISILRSENIPCSLRGIISARKSARSRSTIASSTVGITMIGVGQGWTREQ